MTHRDKYYVYLMTNQRGNVLYVGVTNDLVRRVSEHKNRCFEGFTSKYHVNKLVCYEATENIRSAIEREKEIKKWRREKKNSLVAAMNPEWKDLSKDFLLDE